MDLPLSSFPVEKIGDFHAVIVPDWKSHISDHTIRYQGKPLRPACKDLWILTTTRGDAVTLAKLVQRGFCPEKVSAPRERVLATNREPTFAAVMADVPADVAVYFSASPEVDDQARICAMHPDPARLPHALLWDRSEGYRAFSMKAHISTRISTTPKTFSANLAKARADLMNLAGPSFDTTIPHLNASPILAAMLKRLVRPAAESASYWLNRLGTSQLYTLTIPAMGIVGDLPVENLVLESHGINLHASFSMNIGEMRITDTEVSGLNIPDTIGVGLSAEASRGSLMLSQIMDIPGAEQVRIASMSNEYGGWTANLDPTSIRIDAPTSSIPFDGNAKIREISESGNEIDAATRAFLATLGKERASFILCCVEDPRSGKEFDVSPWMQDGERAKVLLQERCYVLERPERRLVAEFIDALD